MVARLRRLPAGALRAGSVGAVQVATERVKLGWRFEVDGAVFSAGDIPRPRTKKHLPELFFQQSRVGQRPWTPSFWKIRPSPCHCCLFTQFSALPERALLRGRERSLILTRSGVEAERGRTDSSGSPLWRRTGEKTLRPLCASRTL